MARLQDPAASALIPPPTVSGILPESPRQYPGNFTLDDESAALRRGQRALERQLQGLLDAQSAGLSANVLLQDGRSFVEKPPHHPVTPLHEARYGILSIIKDLSAIKEAELETCKSHAVQVRDLLAQTSHWQDNKRKLEDEIAAILSNESGSEIQSLQEEDVKIQEEINAMEQKLSELRVHQRTVRDRLAKGQNSRASELSSYQNSLSMVDSEIQQFIQRPLPVVLEHAPNASTLQSLPRRRRNLDMIVENLRSLQQTEFHAEKEAQKEYHALVEGSLVWEEALGAIDSFEDQLKYATGQLTAKSRQMSAQRPSAASPQSLSSKQDTAELFDGMQATLRTLQNLLEYAEDQGWTLLIATVSNAVSLYPEFSGILVDRPSIDDILLMRVQLGAELDAFTRGQQILQATIDLSAPEASDDPLHETDSDDPGNLLLSHPADNEAE